MVSKPVLRMDQWDGNAAAANDREAASEIRVAGLDKIGAAVWDAFVLREPSATFFHLSGWQRVVERVYGHRTHYLAAVQDGRVIGVLPLVHVRSPLLGSALISNAFSIGGGIAASEPAVVQCLAQAAIALGEELNTGYIELRSERAILPDWHVKSDVYAGFRRPLAASEAENLKAIPRKKRADVRKSLKNGLRIDRSGDIDSFYRIYAESIRNLGTPVFSKKFLAEICAVFGQDCEISVVHGEQGPVAGLVSFYFRDRVMPYYGGGTAGARATHAFDFLYWSQMLRAMERGAGVFDFGRSKYGTGAFDYKTFWGFEPEPLEYQYHLVKDREVPDINPLNPKYRLFVAAWQRLPLSIANRAGPWFARQLG